jgi:photosystem II stability/assembly factor-like uncharacterized protein
MFALSDTLVYALVSGGLMYECKHPSRIKSYKIVADTDISDDLVRMYFTDAQNGFITTGSGKILGTTDGAVTWQEKFSDNSIKFTDIFFADKNNGWAITNKKFLYKTANGGATWQKQDLPGLAEQTSTKRILFVSSNRGFFSAGQEIFETTDAGQTWKRSCRVGKYGVADMCHDKANTLWAVSSQQILKLNLQ